MIEEKFELLDSKISALIDQLKKEKTEKQKLSEENSELRKQNAEIAEKLEGMESDSDSINEKERQVRDRLRLLIEKIDSLE